MSTWSSAICDNYPIYTHIIIMTFIKNMSKSGWIEFVKDIIMICYGHFIKVPYLNISFSFKSLSFLMITFRFVYNIINVIFIIKATWKLWLVKWLELDLNYLLVYFRQYEYFLKLFFVIHLFLYIFYSYYCFHIWQEKIIFKGQKYKKYQKKSRNRDCTYLKEMCAISLDIKSTELYCC